MDVISLANRLQTTIFGSNSDDDFSDRLNYRYTVAFLLLMAVILTTRQYGSEVIKCWVPAHFTSNYESYVSTICWVQNTYYSPLDEKIPKIEAQKESSQIKYYQWVNFVILLQALFFYVPRIFWSTFSVKSGLYLGDLVEAAINYKSGDKFDDKKSFMGYMVKNIDQFVDDKRRHDETRPKSRLSKCLGTCFPCFGRFLGNYIVILYMLTKILFIANTAVQIWFIGGFLEQDFWTLGFKFIYRLFLGEGWIVATSKYFPKVTLCDFMIREIGNPNKSHRYTVQCVLPLNLFNQQIFTLIWFWYVMILCWNMAGLIMWLQRSVPLKANGWITRRVDLFNDNVKQKLVPKRLKHFLNYYLEPDGIFMIRMIANNTSDYVATDLIHQLWCQHDDKYGDLFDGEPHQSKSPCVFEHSTKKERPERNNSRLMNIGNDGNNNIMMGNYASFGQVYDQNNRKIGNLHSQEYFNMDSNGKADTGRSFPPYDGENVAFIRNRNVEDPSQTKV